MAGITFTDNLDAGRPLLLDAVDFEEDLRAAVGDGRSGDDVARPGRAHFTEPPRGALDHAFCGLRARHIEGANAPIKLHPPEQPQARRMLARRAVRTINPRHGHSGVQELGENFEGIRSATERSDDFGSTLHARAGFESLGRHVREL